MSWHFRLIGTNREALKTAVKAQVAPDSIIVEVCERIDGIPFHDGQAFWVESYGHLDQEAARLFRGTDQIVIRVYTAQFYGPPPETETNKVG